jgi:serine/threonine protein kinase
MSPNLDPTPIFATVPVGGMFAGRYEILERLGAGGMCSVYRAQDRLSGEVIALKVIHPSIAADPKFHEKFKQELAIGRKISHPNVVRIHDIGEADGVLFISMEWVDGRTLAQMLMEQGPLPLAEFWKIFHALCDAMACVHGKGFIHRDIKALNIMIDRGGVLKLMDFGIARDTTSEFTMGMISGTPAYMAPELLCGEASPASDIYAAGVVFCELLTGRKPEFLKLPDVPGLSAELKQALQQCLAADAKARYQSVQELVDAVAKASRPAAAATLADYLGSGPADPAAMFPILARVVDAVKGQHPPLAPRTIWLVEGGEVRLESDAAARPQTATAIGEAKYSVPDLFREGGAPGEAVDVYVLGFMFYELLAGRQIFAAQIGGAWNADDVAWFNWHADAGRRLRPLAEVAPGFPAAASKLIEKMVEKDPARRTVSLAEVSRTLHNLGDQTVTHANSGQGRAEDRARRARPVVWLLIAAVLASAGVAAFVFVRGKSPPRSGPEAHAPEPPKVIATETGDMLLVPAGEFLMGNDRGRKSEYAYENEAPAHKVSLSAFYIDKFEVTNLLYKRFCDAAHHARPADPSWDEHYFEKADYPVVNVSWNDARDYAAWAHKRLPSEQEWEKAARGTDGRLYPWGNEFRAGAAQVSGRRPSPLARVGSFPSDQSAYGAMDMAGNAPEWVDSDYRLYPGNRFGPLPPEEAGYKVVRGNGLLGPDRARITDRASQTPQLDPQRHSLIGFRCAVDVRAVQEAMGK